MQAIVTRYLPPTNHRGSRVKAQCEADSLTLAWDYSLDPDENHDAACAALVKRLGWDTYGTWIGGGLPQSNPAHRCYVCVPMLAKARNVLWPGGRRDVEWSPDTLEAVAAILDPEAR